MTKDELGGVVRALAAAGFAWGASRGWFAFIDDATKEALLAAATTLGVSWWSIKAKRKA